MVNGGKVHINSMNLFFYIQYKSRHIILHPTSSIMESIAKEGKHSTLDDIPTRALRRTAPSGESEDHFR